MEEVLTTHFVLTLYVEMVKITESLILLSIKYQIHRRPQQVLLKRLLFSINPCTFELNFTLSNIYIYVYIYIYI